MHGIFPKKEDLMTYCEIDLHTNIMSTVVINGRSSLIQVCDCSLPTPYQVRTNSHKLGSCYSVAESEI